jgi:hypothetical protein
MIFRISAEDGTSRRVGSCLLTFLWPRRMAVSVARLTIESHAIGPSRWRCRGCPASLTHPAALGTEQREFDSSQSLLRRD